MSIDTDKARNRLLARRDELQGLNERSAESRGVVTLDQQNVGRVSRMDAIQQQAMAQATERQRNAELRRIEQALKRLEEGEYGYCEHCGKGIAEKRLEIDPAAAACVRCASG